MEFSQRMQKRLDVGLSFGPFHLFRPIGHGRYSQSWLATCHSDGFARRIRVTMFHSCAPRATIALERAKTLRGTSAPHICRIVEVGRIENLPFIASEWVTGPTLTEVLCRLDRMAQSAPSWLVRAIAEACLSVLDLMRTEGLAPIGLHPSNIILTYDGDVVLSVTDEFVLDCAVAPAWVGGAGYLAPEEIRRQPLDFAADDYAFGVLLHHLLAGRHPRADCASPVEILHSVLVAEPPPLPQSACSVELAEAVCILQSADPTARAAGRQAVRRLLPSLPVVPASRRGQWLCSLFPEDAPLRAFSSDPVSSKPKEPSDDSTAEPKRDDASLAPVPSAFEEHAEHEPAPSSPASIFDWFESSMPASEHMPDIFTGYSPTMAKESSQSFDSWFTTDFFDTSSSFDEREPQLRLIYSRERK